jgi:hypothetical protein
MDHFARFWRPATLRHLTACAALLGLAAAACGGGEPKMENRLWIDHLPDDKRDTLAAMMIGQAGDDKRTYGAFYRGTVFRGSFDAFEWIADPDDAAKAKVRLLQDEEVSVLTIEQCEPEPRFDYCVVLRGDPQGVERYQSRRRWGARGGAATTAGFPQVWAELLADDPELAAIYEDAP